MTTAYTGIFFKERNSAWAAGIFSFTCALNLHLSATHAFVSKISKSWGALTKTPRSERTKGNFKASSSWKRARPGCEISGAETKVESTPDKLHVQLGKQNFIWTQRRVFVVKVAFVGGQMVTPSCANMCKSFSLSHHKKKPYALVE